jgi:hypothetical protein
MVKRHAGVIACAAAVAIADKARIKFDFVTFKAVFVANTVFHKPTTFGAAKRAVIVHCVLAALSAPCIAFSGSVCGFFHLFNGSK